MNKKDKVILFGVIALFMCMVMFAMFSESDTSVASAQSPVRLKQKCRNTSFYSTIEIDKDGNIVLTPCSGTATTFNGVVNYRLSTTATATSTPSASATSTATSTATATATATSTATATNTPTP